MTQEKGVTIRGAQVLSLPDEGLFRKELDAVNRFQAIVHANLIKDQDYGIIPGTQKPTLLKPGAEKIAKLLGLADHYSIIDQKEDWDKPFFRYLIKCSLVNVLGDTTVSEGLGECNSYESKYRWRWFSERDLPAGVDKSKLVSQERHSRAGGKWMMYRFENDDIFSQVNTILKMAKKRALVDAVLSAGRLSNIFTQDMEDITPLSEEKTEPELSPIRRRVIDKLEGKPEAPTSTPEDAPSGIGEEANSKPTSNIDPVWLEETLNIIKWSGATAKSWLKANLKVDANPEEGMLAVCARLSTDKLQIFTQKLADLREASGR